MRGKDREWQNRIDAMISEGMVTIRSNERSIMALGQDIERHRKEIFGNYLFSSRIDNIENQLEVLIKGHVDERQRSEVQKRLVAAGLKPKQVEAAMKVFYGSASGEDG